MQRSIHALWFSKNHDHTQPKGTQMSWADVHSHLESLQDRTAIGWFWLQRRGPEKFRPAKLKAEIGEGIEVYRKPSFLTRYDLTPDELLGWTRPRERNLAQLGITRKDMQENPLWDIWVRIRPTFAPSMTEQRRAENYIKDKTADDRFQAERIAREMAQRLMTPAEKDLAETNRLAPHIRYKLEKAVEDERLEALIQSRAEYRAKLRGEKYEKPATREEALRVHEERIEAGRRMTAAARAAREGKS